MLPQTPAISLLSPAGWLATLALFIGLFIRLIKADKFNDFLAKFSIPAMPKKALPWIAVVLGAGASTVEARLGGLAWKDAVNLTFVGFLSGTMAIGGNETLSTLVRGVWPDLADLIFGKGAGPGDQTKPPTAGGGVGGAALSMLCLVVALSLGSVGCGAIMNALPAIVAAVSDGSMILDQIQAYLDTYFKTHPDPIAEKKASFAIAKCRAALIAAQRTSAGAQKLDQQQIDAAFADFKVAYQELLAIAGPYGVTQEGSTLKASANGLSVPPPAALTLKVAR
jgi:hypothetical protein